LNFVTEERTVSVVIGQDGEEVVRITRRVPASDPEKGAEVVKISDAFEGTDGERFTVDVLLNNHPADTYDYKVTCANVDSADGVWCIMNPATSENGQRTNLVSNHCSGT
jgi:hypothetical protein